MRLRIGVIGGTGLYDVGRSEAIDVETPHGDVVVHHRRLGQRELFFLPRHGPLHSLPPERVNHFANIAGLLATKCDYVLGVNNVGSLRAEIRPGSWTVPTDFVDLHHRIRPTWHQDRAVHVDFGEPYCPTIRKALHQAAPKAKSAVYAGVDGPRFETGAEVKRLQLSGAHVVGMTGVPEAVLAHERGLCYASLAFVGNYATGIGDAVPAQTIRRRLSSRKATVVALLETVAKRLPPSKGCHCKDAAAQADLTLSGKAR